MYEGAYPIGGYDPMKKEGAIVLGTGEGLNPNRLTQLARGYVNAADIGNRGDCHPFRHTMATRMIENDADRGLG